MNLGHCSDEFRDRVWPSLEEAGRERLTRYERDLLHYNRAQNLVSRRDPELRVARLIEESVVAAGILATRGHLGTDWADVGSGGGIPGLILACVHPEQPIALIERRQGRCDFLRREVVALGLERVSVLELDVSGVGRTFGLIVAKAVAPAGSIEGLVDSALEAGGTLAVFGRPADEPADGWRQDWTEELPGEDSVLRGLVRG